MDRVGWILLLLAGLASMPGLPGPPTAAAESSRLRDRRVTAGPMGDLEIVSPDEVAPEDRDARSDVREPSGSLASRGIAGPRATEKEQFSLFADQLRKLWGSIPTYSPVNGRSRLTSGFGWRPSPFSGKREFHGGIDLAAARGTSIVAPADGIVERAFVDPASGLVVVLEHGNGMETVYGHLDRISVWEGKDVKRGEPLGTLGSTGWRSTGPHVHYAVKIEGKYVNPRRYLFENENPAGPLSQR